MTDTPEPSEAASPQTGTTWSLVIPMWNEAARIGDTVAAIAADPTLSGAGLRVILADDGSTDDSRSVGQQAISDNGIAGEVLTLPHGGKGAAVRAGVLHADTDLIAFTDADLSAPPTDIAAVFRALELGTAEVVAGLRTTDQGTPAPPLRKLARIIMRSVVRGTGLTSVPDTQCGLKGFTRQAGHAILEPLETDGFAFDVELLARAQRLGLKVHSEPVAWRHGEGSTVRVARDAPMMLWQMALMLWRRRHWPRSLDA